MKERIARARQALPNGYCGLPLVQTCPHPNACLSCDNFLTDNSFRAVHEQQLERTRTMLTDARERDALRLIEVLERDEQSLDPHPRRPRRARHAAPRPTARSHRPSRTIEPHRRR